MMIEAILFVRGWLQGYISLEIRNITMNITYLVEVQVVARLHGIKKT